MRDSSNKHAIITSGTNDYSPQCSYINRTFMKEKKHFISGRGETTFVWSCIVIISGALSALIAHLISFNFSAGSCQAINQSKILVWILDDYASVLTLP